MVKNLSAILPLLYMLLSTSIFYGQETIVPLAYRIPIDMPLSLSGSYGELRATHFHAGIDIRVGGVVGAPLYAAERGYISRITISSSGYGNAIYIDHPDGNTTLYGHMHEFAPEIARYVRAIQYERKSFIVDIPLDHTVFPVEKGDYIGKAGNSGSSGGPHLHYEFRKTDTQIPLNPVRTLKMDVIDDIMPIFDRVNFYSISNISSMPVSSFISSHTYLYPNIISVTDTFYIAVSGTDRQNNTGAKLAVYDYLYYLDGELVFSFTADQISSQKGRYINSILEYPEKQKNGRYMIKSLIEPGCGLRTNIEARNEGVFILKDDEVHKVRIELRDEYGNTADRTFSVKRGLITASSTKIMSGRNATMVWYLHNRIEEPDFRYSLPPGALYSSAVFNFRKDTVAGYDCWRIGDERIPLHLPATVSIKKELPDSLRNKAVIAIVGNNGRLSSIGGSWRNEWIETKVSVSGALTVAVDTLPPVVIPAFRNGARMNGISSLRLTIDDNMSGIGRYEVYIDDRWVLAAYDLKNKRLSVELDDRVVERRKSHLLLVYVTDNCGNIQDFKSTFIW